MLVALQAPRRGCSDLGKYGRAGPLPAGSLGQDKATGQGQGTSRERSRVMEAQLCTATEHAAQLGSEGGNGGAVGAEW